MPYQCRCKECCSCSVYMGDLGTAIFLHSVKLVTITIYLADKQRMNKFDKLVELSLLLCAPYCSSKYKDPSHLRYTSS